MSTRSGPSPAHPSEQFLRADDVDRASLRIGRVEVARGTLLKGPDDTGELTPELAEQFIVWHDHQSRARMVQPRRVEEGGRYERRRGVVAAHLVLGDVADERFAEVRREPLREVLFERAKDVARVHRRRRSAASWSACFRRDGSDAGHPPRRAGRAARRRSEPSRARDSPRRGRASGDDPRRNLSPAASRDVVGEEAATSDCDGGACDNKATGQPALTAMSETRNRLRGDMDRTPGGCAPCAGAPRQVAVDRGQPRDDSRSVRTAIDGKGGVLLPPFVGDDEEGIADEGDSFGLTVGSGRSRAVDDLLRASVTSTTARSGPATTTRCPVRGSISTAEGRNVAVPVRAVIATSGTESRSGVAGRALATAQRKRVRCPMSRFSRGTLQPNRRTCATGSRRAPELAARAKSRVVSGKASDAARRVARFVQRTVARRQEDPVAGDRHSFEVSANGRMA